MFPNAGSIGKMPLIYVSGLGLSMTRDSVTLMVGQYFKRKREVIEIVMVSGSGLGICAMSAFVKEAIR